MAWAVAINSTSNEEFPIEALEDQQKSPCCIYYMISKIIFLVILSRWYIAIKTEWREYLRTMRARILGARVVYSGDKESSSGENHAH